jgi:hypothetical protein
MHYDDLVKKAHVKNHPLIGQAKAYQRERAVRRLMAQQREDLLDSFSQKEMELENEGAALDGGDQKLSTLVYKASLIVHDLLTQFDIPILPQLRFIKAKDVKRAAVDEDRVVEAQIIFEAQLNSVSNVRNYLEIPVRVVRGSIVPPSIARVEGKDVLLTQHVINNILRRTTSYELTPLNSHWSDPPLSYEETKAAVETRNELGYQPRTVKPMFIASKKEGAKDKLPSGWKEVLELIQKADKEGTDTFPRSYHYLCRKYILEVLPTANMSEWEVPLINMGYALNPYGVNRGRSVSAQDKSLDFEVSDDSSWEDELTFYGDTYDEEPDPEPDEFGLLDWFYEGTKTPIEIEDKIKFDGYDGPIRAQVVELDFDKDAVIVKAKGIEYRVNRNDIRPLDSTFKKMYLGMKHE